MPIHLCAPLDLSSLRLFFILSTFFALTFYSNIKLPWPSIYIVNCSISNISYYNFVIMLTYNVSVFNVSLTNARANEQCHLFSGLF